MWSARARRRIVELVAVRPVLLSRRARPASCAGWGYGAESLRLREVSVNSPAGMPIWPLKMMIPVGAALLALQGLAEVLRCVQCLRDGQWPPRMHDVEELEKQILDEAARKRAAEGAASMSDPGVALMMLGILVFVIMIGFPVAFTLMALGVAFGYYAYFQPHQEFFDNRVFYLLTQNTFSMHEQRRAGGDAAVPADGLPGRALQHSRQPVHEPADRAARHVPASLAVATLVTCALFATATGIVGAVVTLMGMLAFPQMLKERLRRAPRVRRGLRRRLPRHPDPAVDHADRLSAPWPACRWSSCTPRR